MSEPGSDVRPDRRRFLVLMGLAGVGVALPRPALASADGATPAPPGAAPAAPDSAAAPQGPSAEALALAAAVKQRYGDRLSEADLTSIAEDLDGRLEGGRALRKLALANGDEPDTVFHP